MLWTGQFRRNWEARFQALDSLLDEMKSAEQCAADVEAGQRQPVGRPDLVGRRRVEVAGQVDVELAYRIDGEAQRTRDAHMMSQLGLE